MTAMAIISIAREHDRVHKFVREFASTASRDHAHYAASDEEGGDMTITDVGVICATLLGPIFAVQAQQWIERTRAGSERRLDVFKTLMSTRATALSTKHVEALNMIELEFSDPKFVNVLNAWKSYLDQLNTPASPGDPAALALWVERKTDLLTRLLSEMARALGYKFDEVTIRKGAYIPQQHFNDDIEQRQLRAAQLKLLAGQSDIRMFITGMSDEMAKGAVLVRTRDEKS